MRYSTIPQPVQLLRAIIWSGMPLRLQLPQQGPDPTPSSQGSLPDPVTLSDLLSVGRASICQLRGSSAANVASAFHRVRTRPSETY
jgi:hypothetical protein